MIVSQLGARPSHGAGMKAWRLELLWAAPIVAFVAYLFYTWFAVADRYFIFLYFHDMGSGFDTTPFGWVTASRYWMSGLVAGGAVMVPYLAANLALGRLVRSYRAPVWWRLWILCAIPLSIAIPALVMTVNDPVLPLSNAAQVTAALLAGLGLAFGLGRYAAEHPLGYLLLLVDGLGLVFLLIGLGFLDDYQRMVARGRSGVIVQLLLVFAVGIGLIILMTAVYALRRRVKMPGAASWLAAALGFTYLFLPICHHLFFSTDDGSWTDPSYFPYMPDADNYFPRSVLLQIGIWLVVALAALGMTRLRLWLRRRPAAGPDTVT